MAPAAGPGRGVSWKLSQQWGEVPSNVPPPGAGQPRRPGQAAPRADEYNANPPSLAYTTGPMVAAAVAGAGAGGFGQSLMRAGWNPATNFFFWTNPKGRARQIQADRTLLQNARTADAPAGFMKLNGGTMLSPPTQRKVDRMARRRAKRSAVVPPPIPDAWEDAFRRAQATTTGQRSVRLTAADLADETRRSAAGTKGQRSVRFTAEDLADEARRSAAGTEGQRSVRFTAEDLADEARRSAAGTEGQRSVRLTAADLEDAARKAATEADARMRVRPVGWNRAQLAVGLLGGTVGAAAGGYGLYQKVREDRRAARDAKKLFPGNSLRTLARRAAVIPVGAAGFMGIAAGAGMLSDGKNRLAEGIRFRRAEKELDEEALGAIGYGRLYEGDPDKMRHKLRREFRILNRYAPDVAKDPVLAAGALTRALQGGSAYQSPEAYLANTEAAVNLQRSLDATRPDPFAGTAGLLGSLSQSIPVL